jgi:hypothetical protein
MKALDHQQNASSSRNAAAQSPFAQKFLFSALASALIVLIEPVVSQTIASASLFLLPILLDLFRICLSVFHAVAA